MPFKIPIIKLLFVVPVSKTSNLYSLHLTPFLLSFYNPADKLSPNGL